MIPNVGQFVIIYFKTGVQISGNVLSWSDNKSVIESKEKTSQIVINNTLQDVMFYKISLGQEEYEKLKETPKKEPPDIKKLAELKIELNEQEKLEIQEKLTSHQADGMRNISYGLPNNFKVKSSPEHPIQEIARTNPDINAGLQNLFNKKNR